MSVKTNVKKMIVRRKESATGARVSALDRDYREWIGELKKVLPTQAQLAKCYADAEAKCAASSAAKANEPLPRKAKKGKVAK